MKEETLAQENSLLRFLIRVQRLSYIERCSNTLHINRYSVADHSFYCALYGMIFADLENQRVKGVIYDVEEVIRKSLVHDLEESETGDILWPMHVHYPEFKKPLDEVRDKCVDLLVFLELPQNLRKHYIHLWKSSKDDSKEGQLVACMDKFEIAMFATKELSMGNKAFWSLYKNAVSLIKEFNIPSVLDVVEEIEEIYG